MVATNIEALPSAEPISTWTPCWSNVTRSSKCHSSCDLSPLDSDKCESKICTKISSIKTGTTWNDIWRLNIAAHGHMTCDPGLNSFCKNSQLFAFKIQNPDEATVFSSYHHNFHSSSIFATTKNPQQTWNNYNLTSYNTHKIPSSLHNVP